MGVFYNYTLSMGMSRVEILHKTQRWGKDALNFVVKLNAPQKARTIYGFVKQETATCRVTDVFQAKWQHPAAFLY